MSGITQEIPQPSPGNGRGRLFSGGLKLTLALLGLSLLGLGMVKFLVPQGAGPAGDIRQWTQKAEKQALKDYLEGRILVPGLKLDLVTVSKGDNYWGLARARGLSIDDLIGYNPDMQHLNAYIGRELIIGNKPGAFHQVQAGESVAGIEKEYGLEPGSVKKANQIGWRGLHPGQVLFLPAVRSRQLTPEMAELFANRDFVRSPLAGQYTSLLGVRVDPFTGDYKRHNGVDIKASFNALVAAAADGKVTMAGWNGGYGKCVVIEHEKGFRTLYGHLNVILVKPGQQVRQYQYIGKVGKTGRTTGAHLHFSIWKHGKLQDPLKYLW